MNNEISESAKAIQESAKAVQEVAKVTKAGIEATEKLSGFVSRIIHEPLDSVVSIINDRLRFMRWERQVRLVDRYYAIVETRRIKPPLRIAPPKIALPIIENASLEENDELQDLWANLLASAVDPQFKAPIRSAYIDIIKQLEVIDVRILNLLYEDYRKECEDYARKVPETTWLLHCRERGMSRRGIAITLNINGEEYLEAVDNLVRLRCVELTLKVRKYKLSSKPDEELLEANGIDDEQQSIIITPLGIRFVEACVNPQRK